MTAVCNACRTEMPDHALRLFKDDGEVYTVCVDVAACTARLDGKRATEPLFMMDTLNRLTGQIADLHRRVARLEQAVRILGGRASDDL